MMKYDGLIEIYDMTKFYEVGEIVGYNHFHKPNRTSYDQREKPQPQYGNIWRVISYNAKLLPYDLAYDNRFRYEEYTKLVHSDKIKGMKRLEHRFLGWKVRLKSLTNDKYVTVDESELDANPRITSDIVRSKEKMKRDEQIKSILR